MTFSIVGRSKDGKSVGVAVASKFLAVGAYVPAASVKGGALATQAYGNLEFKTKGLSLLEEGMSPSEMIAQFLATDSLKENRQFGVVDLRGRVATYTGSECQFWAGGQAEESEQGSYAAQGNMLAGSIVIEEMARVWKESSDDELAMRLVKSLQAGQLAGGDPRGKQAAAVLVVSEKGGYGGLSDVVVDLRCDDSPYPIEELLRMLAMHELYFGSTPEEELLVIDNELSLQLKSLLAGVGYDTGNLSKDLFNWMGRENYEERWHEGKIDPVVLERLNLANIQKDEDY